MMTGVYIGEICLLGLFAINTTIGPIVLMAVFLGATAIYHATMRHALKPLTTYLPESYDGNDQANMFDTTDHKAFDLSKSDGVPPTEHNFGASKGMTATKAGLFARIFNPQKFKSHEAVKTLLPNYPAPMYAEGEEDRAYYNPAVVSLPPQLWIVRDEMGISQQEVKDSSQVVGITDNYARFNEKNKVVWTQIEQEGSLNLNEVPTYEKRIDY